MKTPFPILEWTIGYHVLGDTNHLYFMSMKHFHIFCCCKFLGWIFLSDLCLHLISYNDPFAIQEKQGEQLMEDWKATVHRQAVSQQKLIQKYINGSKPKSTRGTLFYSQIISLFYFCPIRTWFKINTSRPFKTNKIIFESQIFIIENLVLLCYKSLNRLHRGVIYLNVMSHAYTIDSKHDTLRFSSI